jgi:hypothetical protein
VPLLLFAPPVAPGEPIAVSVLDLWSDSYFENLVLVTHPFVIQERQRNRQKRDKRSIVFGEAGEIGGTITFRMDGIREESYPIESVYDADRGELLLQECSMEMTGYVPEVELNLAGRKVILRDQRLEFVVLD